MTIQDKIRELSSRWYNPEFADRIVSISSQLTALVTYAFEHRVDNEDSDFLRECLRRLSENGELSRPGDDFK